MPDMSGCSSGIEEYKVSAIVPTFNRAAYLPQSLDALLHQSRPLHEIIVIDDGSTDETAEVVKPYLPRIRYYRKENAGKPAALNFALRHVTGDFVWFMDDDDIALPDALERHVGYLLSHPGVDFTYSSGYVFRGETAPPNTADLPLWNTPEYPDEALFANLLEDTSMLMQGMLIPLRCVEGAGGFDPHLLVSEDWDFLLRVCRACKSGFVPSPTFLFRDHDGLRGPAAERHGGRERAAYFQRYDRLVFEKVYEQTPLEAYLPRERYPAGSSQARLAALLKRAYVMAKHGVFERALPDLEQALATDEVLELPPEDRACLAKMTDVHLLRRKDAAHFVRSLCATIPRARELPVLRQYLKGFYWNVRRYWRGRDYREWSFHLGAMGYCLYRYAGAHVLRARARGGGATS